MKTASQEINELMTRFALNGINIDWSDVSTLRRAQMTLHRWAELECGDGNDYSSWAIERDEESDLPYMCIYPHNGEMRRHRVADREKGALRRIAAICARIGIHFYHQTDPRGCALYVSAEPIKDNDYTRGIAVC